ncbi:hypothetical protein EJB05_27068, partial [Eragrostis curvula]
MSQICAVHQLIPLHGKHHYRLHSLLYNPAGVAGRAALALPSPPRIRCSATTGPSLQPHATAVDKPWQAQRAAVLAIGKANPANCMPQDEYADWYFRVTKSDHFAQLKAKMKKIFSCSALQNFEIDVKFDENHGNLVGYNSRIKKRYFHHTEDTFLDHPELVDLTLPSLDARQAILASAELELAAAAAARAIAEWGQPASDSRLRARA